MTENRKPAFRWLGTKDDLVGPATRKRMSGAFKANEPSVPNSLEKSKRILKRVSGNDVSGEQNPPKRTALKPLQPRCPNTMINKPVPLYPRTPQADSSATGLSSPKPLPPVTPEATVAPPAPIGGTSGTSGNTSSEAHAFPQLPNSSLLCLKRKAKIFLWDGVWSNGLTQLINSYQFDMGLCDMRFAFMSSVLIMFLQFLLRWAGDCWPTWINSDCNAILLYWMQVGESGMTMPRLL